MIRFINLTGQIHLNNQPCFAFFCTITEVFLTFDDAQHWTTQDEFEDSYLLEKDKPYWDVETPELKRFIQLIPQDFFRFYLLP